MSDVTESVPHTFYVRGADGETKFVDNLEAGLVHLTGANGYRLTISEGENEVVIRKGQSFSNDGVGGVAAGCGVTVRIDWKKIENTEAE